jgi:DNA topoisomerase-1
VRSAATPLKTFEEDPAMLIKSGIYGAYIAYNGKNYRLPKGAKIETLSYTDCQRIVAKAKK